MKQRGNEILIIINNNVSVGGESLACNSIGCGQCRFQYVDCPLGTWIWSNSVLRGLDISKLLII